LLYAYLPIRSAIIAGQHLDTNNVAPVFGAGSIDWGSNYPPTLDGFLDEVLGRQAGAGLAVVHSFDPAKIAGSGPFWLQHATDQYNVWFLAFAALGIVALARRDPRSLSVVVAGTIGGLFFAYAYRLDIELYRYFLVSSAVTAALAAASTRFVLPRTRPAIVTAAASIALVLLAANIWLNDRSIIAETRYGGAQATIDAVRHDIPDGAIVVAAWYDATTLDYGAAIEHALDSRIIVKAFPQEYMDEYPGWARVRRVFIYANGGTLGYLPQVPQTWLHERPSTLSYYHVYEVIPNAK
jgi:hypothetical protein